MKEILTPSACDPEAYWHSWGEAAGKGMLQAIPDYLSFVWKRLWEGYPACKAVAYDQMVFWGVPAAVVDSGMYVFPNVVVLRDVGPFHTLVD